MGRHNPATAALRAVWVGLAGAFQCDLILRDFAAFVDWRSLRSRIGFGLRGCLRELGSVDRVRVVDWSDHVGLLRGRIDPIAGKL